MPRPTSRSRSTTTRPPNPRDAPSPDPDNVAELGFAAGGHAAPDGVPDPELVEQAKRRSFNAEYKSRILAEADTPAR